MARFKEYKLGDKKYKFDKFMFQGAIICLLLISLYILSINGWDKSVKVYLKCDQKIPCQNPLIDNEDICGKYIPSDHFVCMNEELPAGYTFGKPPPKIIKQFPYISLLFIFAAFIMNHLIHNRKVKFTKIADEIFDDDGGENET